MNLNFDITRVDSYKSNSQKVRVMSEYWVAENMYCPCCGNSHISKLANNSPVADMKCDNCGEIFELKSKQGRLARKIAGGAYSTMIDRINSITNPDLLILQYSKNFSVTDLTLIPKFFFVETVIQKRKPLSNNARRAGWVGCNILFSEIPRQCQIEIICNGDIRDSNEVVSQYKKIKALQTNNIENRSWLIDVLNCVDKIGSLEFSLEDMYKFSDILQHKHPNNHNIEPKIRQQLQVLRDKGFIQFLGKGKYLKL